MIFFMASSSCNDVDADDEWTDKSPSWMITLAFASYLFVEPYMDGCKAVATSMRT